MEGLTFIFYFLLMIIIYHEFEKFCMAELVFLIRRNPKDYINNPLYKEIKTFDLLEFFLIIYGIFFDPYWYCFLAIEIISLLKIQYINPTWMRIDNFLTVALISLAYCNQLSL